MSQHNKKPKLNYRIVFGFDFGTKRIGIAIGQGVTQEARPLTTLLAKAGVPVWSELDTLIKKWRPDALVVGMPLNMDGTEQDVTTQARQFAESLSQRYHLPLHLIDERLTTKSARAQLFEQGGYRALQDGQVDAVAAQLILENWLSSQP